MPRRGSTHGKRSIEGGEGSDEAIRRVATGFEGFPNGIETATRQFGELVRPIRYAVGARALAMNMLAWEVMPLVSMVNRLTGDITLHREELDALMAGLASAEVRRNYDVSMPGQRDWLPTSA